MSLKKKIIFSFVISASIIEILLATAYFNLVDIKKEIRYLELSDTIRSTSLQLRRHEKNFFLYRDVKEIARIHYSIGNALKLRKLKKENNTLKKQLRDLVAEAVPQGARNS